MDDYDVVVIGGGPAGLQAALSAHSKGTKTLIVEREARLGGILKQCIHDGFGLIRFNERLTGPEYAEKYIKMVREEKIPFNTSTFLTDAKREENYFILSLINSERGGFRVSAKALILANGCRERTSRQVFIHGDRPAGILTAGTAQHFVNINGYLPCKKCVILGSGDIGLIMARRLTLEGAEVVGVYEAKPTPSGLERNIIQCLKDFGIPLYLSKTVSRVFGNERVRAVKVVSLDKNMERIKGTEEIIECDGLILSVGLIPENETAENLKVAIDRATKGPYVDQNLMTRIPGVFSCGNALHVNDLVDYVSESGKIAGEGAGEYVKLLNRGPIDTNINEGSIDTNLIDINYPRENFLYVVPQNFDLNSVNKKLVLYFRVRDVLENKKVIIKYGDKKIFEKNYKYLRPPEMERVELNLNNIDSKEKINSKENIDITMV